MNFNDTFKLVKLLCAAISLISILVAIIFAVLKLKELCLSFALEGIISLGGWAIIEKFHLDD
jgi:flagellar biosynthesis protein FliQ